MRGFFAIFWTLFCVLGLVVSIQLHSWPVAAFFAFVLTAGIYLGLRDH